MFIILLFRAYWTDDPSKVKGRRQITKKNVQKSYLGYQIKQNLNTVYHFGDFKILTHQGLKKESRISKTQLDYILKGILTHITHGDGRKHFVEG